MVVAFASRLVTAVLTHRADHADAPISSPLALSSCRSVVAMVVAISSLLVTAVLTRIADRAEAPISLPPALSSIVSRVAMVSACSPYRIAAVLKYRADRAETPGLMLDDCGAGRRDHRRAHLTDRAGTPTVSPPAQSSIVSTVAMMVAVGVTPDHRRARRHDHLVTARPVELPSSASVFSSSIASSSSWCLRPS